MHRHHRRHGLPEGDRPGGIVGQAQADYLLAVKENQGQLYEDSRSTLDAMPSSLTRSLVNRVTLPLQPPYKPHCVDAHGPAIIYCGSATIILGSGHV